MADTRHGVLPIEIGPRWVPMDGYNTIGRNLHIYGNEKHTRTGTSALVSGIDQHEPKFW